MPHPGQHRRRPRKLHHHRGRYLESVFHSLKVERVHHRLHATRAEARRDLLARIEGFHGSRRPRAAPRAHSPAAMERMAARPRPPSRLFRASRGGGLDKPSSTRPSSWVGDEGSKGCDPAPFLAGLRCRPGDPRFSIASPSSPAAGAATGAARPRRPQPRRAQPHQVVGPTICRASGRRSCFDLASGAFTAIAPVARAAPSRSGCPGFCRHERGAPGASPARRRRSVSPWAARRAMRPLSPSRGAHRPRHGAPRP